jgi:hypothetical protein
MVRRALVMVLLLGILGCGKDGSKKPDTTDKPSATAQGGGEDKSKKKGEPEDVLAEIERLPQVEAVHFAKLIEFLPPAPKGYEAQEPRGERISVPEAQLSFAERRYAGDHKSVVVTIQDGAHRKSWYVPFALVSRLNREHTDGYEKGITLAGNLGIETYASKPKQGELLVLIGKRYIVKVVTIGEPPEFMRTVLDSIETKKLAELK